MLSEVHCKYSSNKVYSCTEILPEELMKDLTSTISISAFSWKKSISDKPQPIQEFSVSVGEGVRVSKLIYLHSSIILTSDILC